MIPNDRVDDCRVFWRPREGVGDDICFPLDVPDVRRILSNISKLILLTYSLRVGLLVKRGNQGLVVRIEGELSSLEHGFEMPYSFERG